MSPRTRFHLQETLIAVGCWTALLYLYFVVAFYGPFHLYRDSASKAYVGGPLVHLEVLVEGALFGVFFALIHYLGERTALRRRPFGQMLLIKTTLYAAALLVVAAVMLGLYTALGLMPDIDPELLAPRFWCSVMLYLVFCTVLINLVMEMRRKIGPGTLSRLLSGHYFQPREEERLFLFVDLKGSTTLAERLGHSRYSEFIKECYRELSEAVLNHGAQVDQYLGDGALLSWESGGGAEDACVALFEDFQSRLEARDAEFREQFGEIPVFRGGADLGPVTATEVGDVRRVVTYHGDVLNTAARLQDQCKELGVRLLVSERVRRGLSRPAEHRGQLSLRGKQETVEVYSVKPPGV